MKQVLTITDLSTINTLVNLEISRISTRAREIYSGGTFKRLNPDDKEVKERLENDVYYQDLVHLKNSLKNIAIEVETADVQVDVQLDNNKIIEEAKNLLRRK